jgi:hypothetical protein
MGPWKNDSVYSIAVLCPEDKKLLAMDLVVCWVSKTTVYFFFSFLVLFHTSIKKDRTSFTLQTCNSSTNSQRLGTRIPKTGLGTKQSMKIYSKKLMTLLLVVSGFFSADFLGEI